MALIRNPDRGEFTGAQKLRQAHGVAPVGFDAITRLLRDQRRRHHVARMTEARNLPVKPIAGRPRFVAECQPLVLAGKFAHQLRRRLRGVLDLTKKSHFAIAPNIRDRDRITQLRGIKTHKSFAMLAHDSPSLLEALPGPFRVTLATASRVSRLRKGRDIQSEERAPKSGLPDFGNLKVSKSATADFDARVSKDGSEQPKSAVADFGDLRAEVGQARLRVPCIHPSRRPPKRAASSG